MRRLIASFLFALGFAFAAGPAQAEQAPVYTSVLSHIAVGGYDPVAYFTDGRPVRGSEQFKLIHQGYEYRFATQAHLDTFRANPARYLPQYGGYCAWAVAQGRTAAGNPQNWHVVDGRLYLNYNSDIQHRWEIDIPGNISRANANWPSVLAH